MRESAMLGTLTVFGLLVSALIYTPGADAIQTWAPIAVDAADVWTDQGAAAVISWGPGTTAADYYKVYGVNGTSLTFIDYAYSFTSPAPGGFGGYAVSGVKNGIESDAVYAAIVPCVDISTTPPNVHLGNCGLVAPVWV